MKGNFRLLALGSFLLYTYTLAVHTFMSHKSPRGLIHHYLPLCLISLLARRLILTANFAVLSCFHSLWTSPTISGLKIQEFKYVLALYSTSLVSIILAVVANCMKAKYSSQLACLTFSLQSTIFHNLYTTCQFYFPLLLYSLRILIHSAF